jgi:hypothetical protein
MGPRAARGRGPLQGTGARDDYGRSWSIARRIRFSETG